MKIDTSTGELTPLNIDEFHENLPDEMLQAQRWLLWEERQNPDPTKKPLKVPYYSAGTPRGATDTPEDAARLVSFDDAFDAYINNLGKYNGIGFALGNDGTGNCWQGIDFDGLSKHQHLAELKEILPGYVEVSPNGDGVHCIGYGKQFEAIGANKEDGIEAYSTGRYFTVTANALQNGALHDLNAFIDRHLHPIVAKRTKAKSTQEEYESYDLTKNQIAHVRSALTIFDAEDRPTWINFGIALKKHGNVGRSLWIEWSQQSDKYDANEASKKWAEFKIDTRYEMDFRHIITSAQNAGWLNPNSSVEDIEEWTVLDEPISPNFFASGPKSIEYVIDGFNATGITMIAGASGVGKTSVLAPLAAMVAGLWHVPGMNITLHRHIVYVTEDPAQIHRILSGLIINNETAKTAADFDQWFHVITADRRTMDRIKFSINNWRKKYSYTAGEEYNNYIIEPLIVLDTTNATIDLENENDNSEVGKYISTIKQSIGPGSCWLIAHLTKLTTSSSKLDDLSPRGAGAFVGDSNATAFLIKDAKVPDRRYMLLGKRRFEATYNALEFNSVTSTVTVETPWGHEQEIIYRYGVPVPSDVEQIKVTEKAHKDEEKAKDDEFKQSVIQMEIMSYIRQEGGVDVPWSEIKMAINRKQEDLRDAIKALVESGRLLSYSSGTHKTAAKFYSLNVPSGVDP
jgi:hypothetical protein